MILPEYYETHKAVAGDDFWCVGFIKNGKTILQLDTVSEETEADARAKMLIYLKENNLLK